MEISDYTTLVQGVVRLAVAGLILREFLRIGVGVPRVGVALIGFLVLNGMASLNDSSLVGENAAVAAALDVGSVAVLLILLLNARRLAQGLAETMDEARFQVREYERARRDYRQLVGHRMLNPLAVIRGSAQTLQSTPGLDERARADLLGAIVAATHELEQISLEPERRGPEERGLEPEPRPWGRDQRG